MPDHDKMTEAILRIFDDRLAELDAIGRSEMTEEGRRTWRAVRRNVTDLKIRVMVLLHGPADEET